MTMDKWLVKGILKLNFKITWQRFFQWCWALNPSSSRIFSCLLCAKCGAICLDHSVVKLQTSNEQAQGYTNVHSAPSGSVHEALAESKWAHLMWKGSKVDFRFTAYHSVSSGFYIFITAQLERAELALSLNTHIVDYCLQAEWHFWVLWMEAKLYNSFVLL